MNNIEILEMQLKKIKDFCKDNNHYYPEDLPYYMFWNGKQAEIVENLIQENKELKEREIAMRRKIYKLEEDNIVLLRKDENTDKTNYKYVECPKVEAEWYKSENYIKDNYIPKSKVKEKIEEFNIPILNVLDKLPIMPQTIERGCGAKDGIIYVLQELLEEGE